MGAIVLPEPVPVYPQTNALENRSFCVGLTIFLNTFKVLKNHLILGGLKEYKKESKTPWSHCLCE